MRKAKTKMNSVRTSLECLENLYTPDLLVTSFADCQWSLTGSHELESQGFHSGSYLVPGIILRFLLSPRGLKLDLKVRKLDDRDPEFRGS